MRMPVFCWDVARRQPSHRRGLSGSDRDFRDAAARSVPRLSFLHARRPGQRDDVRQPVLGLGSPGGLHPGIAGVGIFSEVVSTFSGKPLFGYRSIGCRHDVDLRAVIHRLAAPLLHHGAGAKRSTASSGS